MGWFFNYLVFPLLVPLIAAWLLVARALALASPLLLLLPLALGRRLRWAVPFVEDIYRQRGGLRGWLLRVQFEGVHCINVVRRLLTLPLRRRLPDFYIVGFPKAGTTSLASYLARHPAIIGIDGLGRYHEVLSKESHFFNGVLGRHSASSRLLYRSFFPTVLTTWWKEVVLRLGKVQVFDACPLPSCLPYTAKRMATLTPNAKLIFMLRDPVSSAFSAEIMLRNLGVPLKWSLMEDVKTADPRFADSPELEAFWKQVEQLGVDEPLPEDLMQRFYYHCGSILRSGKYADRIEPFLKHFSRRNMLFIDFQEFTLFPEAVLQQVFEFVGVDPAGFTFAELPPGMQGDRRGRRMHPNAKRRLQEYYRESNLKLYSLLGRDFSWGCDLEAARPGPIDISASSAHAAELPHAEADGGAEEEGPRAAEAALGGDAEKGADTPVPPRLTLAGRAPARLQKAPAVMELLPVKQQRPSLPGASPGGGGGGGIKAVSAAAAQGV